MSFDLSTLVFDRTQADVDNGTAKGVYSGSAMQRTKNAAIYAAEIFQEGGYSVTLHTLPYFGGTDYIPRVGETVQLMENVAAVGRLVRFTAGDPPVLPADLRFLTWQKANNIERYLYLVGRAAENMQSAWMQSGQTGLFSGVI